MTKILAIFQITTKRSAWAFLFGSVLLFLFGIYQVLFAITPLSDTPNGSFIVNLFSIWFLVTGIYIVISIWALFSAKGRNYLELQESRPKTKPIVWYAKFLFACFAASLATVILCSTLLLPFLGHTGFDAFVEYLGLLILLIGLLWSPVIFKYLK